MDKELQARFDQLQKEIDDLEKGERYLEQQLAGCRDMLKRKYGAIEEITMLMKKKDQRITKEELEQVQAEKV